jgi:hypothetical protein
MHESQLDWRKKTSPSLLITLPENRDFASLVVMSLLGEKYPLRRDQPNRHQL